MSRILPLDPLWRLLLLWLLENSSINELFVTHPSKDSNLCSGAVVFRQCGSEFEPCLNDSQSLCCCKRKSHQLQVWCRLGLWLWENRCKILTMTNYLCGKVENRKNGSKWCCLQELQFSGCHQGCWGKAPGSLGRSWHRSEAYSTMEMNLETWLVVTLTNWKFYSLHSSSQPSSVPLWSVWKRTWTVSVKLETFHDWSDQCCGPKWPKNVPSPSVIWTKSFESAKLKRLNLTLMKWPLAILIVLIWWKSLGYLHSPDSLYLADVQTKGEAILCPITGIVWASSSGKTPSEWKMFNGPTNLGVEYFCQINCLELWRSDPKMWTPASAHFEPFFSSSERVF